MLHCADVDLWEDTGEPWLRLTDRCGTVGVRTYKG